MSGAQSVGGNLYWKLQLAGWAALFILELTTTTLGPLSPERISYLFAKVVLGFISTIPLRVVARRLWSTYHREFAIVCTILLAVGFGIAQEAASELVPHAPWRPAADLTIRRVLAESLDRDLTMVCWCIFYFSIKAYFEAIDWTKRLRKLNVLVKDAQLHALRSQTNPHFLFNTLNAISSLVAIDRPYEARQMLSDLAELMSEMLDTRESVTDLATEMRSVVRYLSIQQTRFGASLKLQTDIKVDAAQTKVPRWLLIPLVENAIQYGFSLSRGGVVLKLQVEAHDQELLLTAENQIGHGDVPPRTGGIGLGLKNTRDLLEALYGDLGTMTSSEANGHFSVVIRLPPPFQKTSVAPFRTPE